MNYDEEEKRNEAKRKSKREREREREEKERVFGRQSRYLRQRSGDDGTGHLRFLSLFIWTTFTFRIAVIII